jgi:hypothetical protein
VLEHEEYYQLFEEGACFKHRGEASVQYLYHYESAIDKIHRELGDVRIIIILRNPCERALSNYYSMYGDYETCSFEQALEMEEERVLGGFNSFWFYRRLGLYCHQVKAYLDNFSAVKILTYEAFYRDPDTGMHGLFEFLGLDSSIRIDSSRIMNPTKIPRTRLIKRLLSPERQAVMRPIAKGLLGEDLSVLKRLLLRKPDYGSHGRTCRELSEDYRDDIKSLETLTKMSLGDWKPSVGS